MSESNTGLNEIFLSSSPHYTMGDSTQRIMALVLISLLPECVWGVIAFGVKALVLLVVCVASCVISEYVFQKVTRQKVTVSNLSAAVTGVLLALVLSCEVKPWMAVLGSVVAVVIAKGLFGGIGSNVFNPALTGRGFMVISFGAAMGKWKPLLFSSSASVDVMSSATILNGIKNGSASLDSAALLDCFFGRQSGCIGEVSSALIVLSFLFLLVTKVIDPRATFGMLAAFALGTFAAGLADKASVAAACYDVLVGVCTGGVLFGAVFMVTDYATTPVTKKGRLVFGLGCGLITFLIRRFGGYPEGVMFSILIMNSVSSFLNKLTARKYGYGKKGGAK